MHIWLLVVQNCWSPFRDTDSEQVIICGRKQAIVDLQKEGKGYRVIRKLLNIFICTAEGIFLQVGKGCIIFK